MVRPRVVVVGAGQSGAQAAISLRQRKFDGDITIIGEEPDFPYERPPLSKEYLAGEKPFERILHHPPLFWSEREIELKLGHSVTAIDADRHCVSFRSGEEIEYTSLIWAAGGSPRRLSCNGANLARVHSVRTRADVDAIRSELPKVKRVAIIGGGYIGLEAAAVLRKLGKDVVLLEMLDRVLARVAGEPISRFYESEHRARGVDIRTGIIVDCIEEQNGAACGVRLSDGEAISAEMVVVGVGISPNVEPLAAAGAVTSNGVHVDEHCRTTLSNIFAVGDCALHQSRYAEDGWVRLESVQNANDQAQTAARWITGEPQPYETVPWFWSNQYDLKLQTIGLSVGHDDLVIRGDQAARTFSVVYLRDGKVVALDCVNDVKDYVQGKALVQAGVAIPKERLLDSSIPLKNLL